MKAALLKKFGSPLSIENIPNPVLGTGEVIVDVICAPVLPYAKEVFSGERKYLLSLPVAPGCGAIGRIRQLGPDATTLKIGDWVFCDPTVRSRDNKLIPDITLQGWSARGEGGQRLEKFYHNGPFAQQMLLPTENAIPIGNINDQDAAKWCALNTLLIPYGGLLAANFKAGESILVSGATGNFGSATIEVAIAMGAGFVVAPGRNEKILAELKRDYGHRIIPVKITGDHEMDLAAIKAASPGPIDCVLDFLPPSAGASAVRTAIMTVRPYGRAILMGGVGMSGGEELSLPYPWIMRNCVTIIGQWMYPTEATTLMNGLIRSGLINLDKYQITEFPLVKANQAVEQAASKGGRWNMIVIRP